MMKLLEKKYDEDLFKDTDLEFLNNIPNMQVKLDNEINQLIKKKNELYEILGSKNIINSNLKDANLYLNNTTEILEKIYNKISDYTLIRIELNEIEKSLITIIESFNIFSSLDNNIIENIRLKIPESLNQPIENFKNNYSEIETRIL